MATKKNPTQREVPNIVDNEDNSEEEETNLFHPMSMIMNFQIFLKIIQYRDWNRILHLTQIPLMIVQILTPLYFVVKTDKNFKWFLPMRQTSFIIH